MNAVITGLGAASPIGLGAEAYWKSALAGEHGIRRITRFDAGAYPSTLAGEIPDFNVANHVARRLIPQTDHVTRLAIAAADWALQDSGINLADVDEFHRGVVTSTGAGGFEFGHEELEKLWSKGPRHVSAFQSFAWFYAVNTGQLSIRHEMRGACTSLVSGEAGGLDSLGQARRNIADGQQVVLAGGFDSRLCPWGWVASLSAGEVSRATDPADAFLPFDSRANGSVPGEGGALLIVEDDEHARQRGARVHGELAGYAATFDPPPNSPRPPTLEKAIRAALADALTRPEEVDVVFADAAATPVADRREAEAITAVFGEHGVPVAVPKTAIGRLEAGGSAIDAVAALLSMRDSIIPPAVHARPRAECPLDVVTTARERSIATALILSRGRGGYNSALVLRSAH